MIMSRVVSRHDPLVLVVVFWVLRLITAAALAVDAYLHADLAHRYDLNRFAPISQGDLFRIEAGIASLMALLVLVAATRVVWAVAFLVAASALGAVLLYAHTDVGALGPLPDMYEPLWYPRKTAAAFAEGAATAGALLGFALAVWYARGRRARRLVAVPGVEQPADAPAPADDRQQR
jgi:hypothetical protein